MMTRWWWMALGAVGALGVQAWSAQDPARHWIERDGTDRRRLGHEAQTAWVEEFLAGAAFGQAAEQACSLQELRAQRQGCEWTGDSAGLTRAIGERRRTGGSYWWHDHRPLPSWYAF